MDHGPRVSNTSGSLSISCFFSPVAISAYEFTRAHTVIRVQLCGQLTILAIPIVSHRFIFRLAFAWPVTLRRRAPSISDLWRTRIWFAQPIRTFFRVRVKRAFPCTLLLETTLLVVERDENRLTKTKYRASLECFEIVSEYFAIKSLASSDHFYLVHYFLESTDKMFTRIRAYPESLSAFEFARKQFSTNDTLVDRWGRTKREHFSLDRYVFCCISHRYRYFVPSYSLPLRTHRAIKLPRARRWNNTFARLRNFLAREGSDLSLFDFNAFLQNGGVYVSPEKREIFFKRILYN